MDPTNASPAAARLAEQMAELLKPTNTDFIERYGLDAQRPTLTQLVLDVQVETAANCYREIVQNLLAVSEKLMMDPETRGRQFTIETTVEALNEIAAQYLDAIKKAKGVQEVVQKIRRGVALTAGLDALQKPRK